MDARFIHFTTAVPATQSEWSRSCIPWYISVDDDLNMAFHLPLRHLLFSSPCIYFDSSRSPFFFMSLLVPFTTRCNCYIMCMSCSIVPFVWYLFFSNYLCIAVYNNLFQYHIKQQHWEGINLSKAALVSKSSKVSCLSKFINHFLNLLSNTFILNQPI